MRFFGDINSTPEAVERLVTKLSKRHSRLSFCYEAGPTGYGLYRQIEALGHECIVVAPSLIPRRSGERVKTNRRDAQSLARLLRAGELTAVWVPDETHEAVRDLVRTRGMAVEDYRRKRQHVTAFLLRHGRSYDGKTSWRGRHKRWLDGQNFGHPAQRLAYQEMLNAVQAMPRGGELILSAARSNGLAKIDVIDTGPGIPAEQLPNIFKAYYSTKKSGTGLGLAIGQRVAMEHGGTLAVTSEVGKGTDFPLQLPLN